MSETTIEGIRHSLERLHAGDLSAKEDLFQHAERRLRLHIKKMFHDYPPLQQWLETDDVYQDVHLKLIHLFESIPIHSVEAFFSLATKHTRFVLLDLWKKHVKGDGKTPRLAPAHGGEPEETSPIDANHLDTTCEPSNLANWGEIHETIAQLPEAEHEIFSLLWYQGLKQKEAAELLGVSLSTVELRWLRARRLLQEKLNGELPE